MESTLRPAIKLCLVAVLLSCILPCLSSTASAELGGDAASVEADQLHMKARLKTSKDDGYTVHEIQAASGTVVREYVSADGKVFGVAWRGPYLPDLHQILGASFAPFTQAARAQRRRRGVHGPVSVQNEGLVAISGGHARDYFGKAYLPALMPSGISPEEIQ